MNCAVHAITGRSIPHVRRILIFVVAAMSLLAGCVSLDQSPPEQIVSKRSIERAGFLMANDYEVAYRFSTPGYRSLETVSEFSTRYVGASMWEEAKVAKVACSGMPTARCDVALAISVKLPPTGLVTTHLQETWVLSAGNWYFYEDIGL